MTHFEPMRQEEGGKHMALRVLPDAGVGQEGCLLKEPRVQTNKKLRKKTEHKLQQVKAERSGLREGLFFNIQIFLNRD